LAHQGRAGVAVQIDSRTRTLVEKIFYFKQFFFVSGTERDHFIAYLQKEEKIK
jgi:hypothetical protein